MGLKIANNGYGILASGISSVATSIPLLAGHGARFGAFGAGDYMYATLISNANQLEIVKITGRAGDNLTPVVRGQDGTAAIAFSAGERIECRPCNAAMRALIADAALGHGVQAFTVNGAIAFPTEATDVLLLAWGPGGGGAATDATLGLGGGGGGGGGFSIGFFTRAQANGQAVVIGTGGVGGNPAGANGVAGGTTSVGALISATGGTGGVVAGGGGAGGSGATGALNLGGQAGSGASGASAGAGGAAPMMGIAGTLSGTGSGAAPSNFSGGGGSGGGAGQAGIAGADGLVIAIYFGG